MPNRPALPYVSPQGHTVTVVDGRIYINARLVPPVDALDLSAVIAHAVAASTVAQRPAPMRGEANGR